MRLRDAIGDNELISIQLGSTEVCFIDDRELHTFIPKDEGYDVTFAQLRKVLEDERFQYYAQVSSEKK